MTIAAKMNDDITITAKRSRCVADGQRHASNIAGEDEKSIWIRIRKRRPGICGGGGEDQILGN
jgi:hypothetical protein